MPSFYNPLNALINIGLEPTAEYIEKKRILMVNFIALLCVPCMFYFTIINFLDERYLLSTINFINTLTSIITLIFQYLKKYKTAKIILLFCTSVCFFCSAMLYQNAGQYFLIAIMIITMLLYDDYRIHVFCSIFMIMGIISVEMMAPIFPITNPLPKSRSIFNILISLIFILFTVNFYIQIIYNKLRKIEEQRENLKSANQEKERIFSIIAHDIKSPFATLESLTGALRDQIINNEDSQSFIEQIHHKITLQNKILDDLLKWGSVNIKGGTKKSSLIYIKPIVTNIIHTFKEQSQRKKINFNISISDDDQAYVNADHLIVILRNFISNAIKFSYTNGIISIHTTTHKKQILIHIKDNGIGMNNVKRSLLFTEIQNRSSGTSNEPGSGLGLVLCRDLIQQNNGTIMVESKPKKGTLFIIGFPKRSSLLNEYKISRQ